MAISFRSAARVARSALSLRNLTRLVRQAREHVVHFLADVVAQALVLFEDLLAQLALALGELLVERGRAAFERSGGVLDFARHRAVRLEAAVVLGLDVVRDRLELGLRVLLERGKPAADLLFQIRGFLDDAIFEAGEAAIELAHLIAEQDVADLVDAGRASAVRRRVVGGRGFVVPG